MLPSRAEQWHLAILDLLREVNLCQPDRLPQLISAVTQSLALDIKIFLVDFEQRVLHEFGERSDTSEELPVEGTLAGLAFQRSEIKPEPGDPRIRWVPLLDSTERLGVLRVASDQPSAVGSLSAGNPEMQFANLVGHLIAAKTPYGDRINRVRSSQPMTVASVLLRQLLPPSTCTSDRIVVSASLQPAYAVGGDAFDYAIDDDSVYAGIFDAVGHDLEAGLSVAVALSAGRAARRNGQSIESMASAADEQLESEFGNSQFVTAVLAQLDLRTGSLRYLNCGHPPPIVLRPQGGGAEILEGGRRLPLALRSEGWKEATYRMQPGDRLMLYTDGVIHARDGRGGFFDVDRLVDFARRHIRSDETTPEIARKINDQVIAFHGDLPDDDATVMLVEWSPAAANLTAA